MATTIKNLLPAVVPLAPSTPTGSTTTPAASSTLTPSDWSEFRTLGDRALIAIAQAAKEFAAELCTPLSKPRWLSLLGSSGAGKTMLARMIYQDARVFADRHPYLESGRHIRRVRFVTWPKVAARLRDGDHDVLSDIQRAWLLVVDDVGAEHEARNSYLPSKLYDLCNARLGRWTVFTSNFNLAQIAERIDPRIASRLRRDGSLTIEVSVKDFGLR